MEHAAIISNVLVGLANLLRDRPCRVYTSDARIRIEEINVATYPNVSVVCGPVVRASDDHDGITNPVLLVEVLSPTTSTYDRDEKFGFYRRISSLKDYVLVSQRAKRVEVYQRGVGRHWDYADYESGEQVKLSAVDGGLSVDEIYDKVTLVEYTHPRR